MSKLAALLGSVLLTACATTPSEVATLGLVADATPRAPVAAPQPVADLPPAAEIKTVEMNELEQLGTGYVCESLRRTGSRIPQEVCYVREERAAEQTAKAEAAKRYLRDLEREQMYNDQAESMREQQRALGGMAR